jgi:diketogulonate reductase-like aldo/keto reductase
MKLRPFGGTGHQASVIGQGTWYIDRGDRRSAVAALRRGIDLGMTHIDTAEMYGEAELKRDEFSLNRFGIPKSVGF